ncbi:MAG: hypothetical protein WBW33_06375 [Bryobacteraceae bacterium]
MSFIEEKLNSVDKLNYVVYLHDNKVGNDWTNTWGTEISGAHANAGNCWVSFNDRIEREGETVYNGNIGWSLKDVMEIEVAPLEHVLRGKNAKLGHPGWTARVEPPIFVVRVQLKGVTGEANLADEVLANRVAAALNHAVELYGGRKEPF